MNPYVNAPAPQRSWMQRSVIDNPWLEGAAGLSSLIPVVGGGLNAAWQGTRGAYHAAQGNYGQAAEAAAWGAAGFIPGGAVARSAKLGLAGAKSLRAGNAFRQGVNAVRAADALAPAVKGFRAGAKQTLKGVPGMAADSVAISTLGGALTSAKPLAGAVPLRNPNASFADQLAYRATQVPGYAIM